VFDPTFTKLRRHLYRQNLTILIGSGFILILCGLLILGLQYVLLQEKASIKTNFITNINYLRKQEQLLTQLYTQNNKAWMIFDETKHVNYSETLIPELATTINFNWRVPTYLSSLQTSTFYAFVNYLAEFYSNFWLSNVMPAAPMVLFTPHDEINFAIPANQKLSTNIKELPTNGKIIWQIMENNPQQAIGIINSGLNNNLYLASIFKPYFAHYNSQFFGKNKLWLKVNDKIIIGDNLPINLIPNKLTPTSSGFGLCLVDDIYQGCYLISYADFLQNNLWLLFLGIILATIILPTIFYYRNWLLNHVISDAINNQQQLIDAKQSADAANLAKSQFLTTISHEIRTPLYGVISGLELLELTLKKPKQKQQIKRIQKTAHVLHSLLTNILDLSKIEQGLMHLELNEFSPKRLATDCIKTFSAFAAVRNVTLKLIISNDLPNNLIGDVSKLQQIINNLLNNAIKFSDGGIIELHITLIEQREFDCILQFKVKDYGCGMTNRQLEHLFKPINSKTGAGLGLSICQKLAQLIQSEIKVDSALKQGSTFSFTVNFKINSKISNAKSANQTKHLYANLGLHILVIEDNQINQETLNEQLEQLGCSSLMLLNAEEALKFEINNFKQFDIILTDINLPNINGLELTTKLRELGVTTPIIGITAGAFSEQIKIALNCGMNDCLIKPINLNDLQIRLAITSQKINKIAPKLAPIFKQTMQNDLSNLENAIKCNDFLQVNAILHRISGSLAVTNNLPLADICHKLQSDFVLSKWLNLKALLYILLQTCEIE